MTKPPAKKRKKPAQRVILFDEAKRAEYLTGFHKRKVERRKHAIKRAAEELKEEKRLLKERHEALVLERAGVLAPDMQLIECEPVTEELPDHTVTVTELDLRPATVPTAPANHPPPSMSKKSFNKKLKDELKMKPSKRKFQRKSKSKKKTKGKRKAK